MKMNKLAAGALALALGLGAVAPAVASETKWSYKEPYKSAEIFAIEHKDQLARANAALKAYRKAEKAYNAAVAERKAAEAQVNEYGRQIELVIGQIVLTSDTLDHVTPIDESIFSAKYEKARTLKRQEVVKQYDKLDEISVGLTDGVYDIIEKKLDRDDLQKVLLATLTPSGNATIADVQAQIRNFVSALKTYDKWHDQFGDHGKLVQKYNAAVERLAVARTDEADKEAALGTARREWRDALTDLEFAGRGYAVSIQFGNDGIKVTDKKASLKSEFDIKKLEAAREKALTTLEAVNLLKKLAPQKLKGVEKEVDALVKEQKELLKLADKYIAAAKKMALVSTAYADDEEMTPEQVTDALNEKSDKIQDLISDKKEEKPAEKEEEKPAKKEEDKKEEEKPARRAGNNARTGVAGIAGVAGILAAASVAYAASKRD